MNSLLFVLFLASTGLQAASPSVPNTWANATSSSSARQDNSFIEPISHFRRTTDREFTQLAKSLDPTASQHFVSSLRRARTVLFSTSAGAAGLQRPVPTPSRKVQLAPRDLTATAIATNQINLTWTNNSDKNTGFYVERAQSPTGPWTRVASLPGSATSCANSGLKASTTYYYRLFLRQASYSNVASATTHSLLPDGAPSHLVAKAEASTIKVSWTNNTGDATGIKIERCQGAACSNFTQIATVTAEVTSYQDTGLAPGMSYSYRVQAYNSALRSAYSNTATVNTARNTNPPTIPTGVTATVVSSTRINVTWTKSTGNGSEVAGYNLYQSGARIGSTMSTAYSVKGLEAKTQYCYTVTAYDQSGNASAQSDPACATTKSPDDP